MEQNDKVELEIQVSDPNASDDELDNMPRQVLSEVRELSVESAELAKGGIAPAGAKREATTVGAIAIEMLPSVLPGVIPWCKAGVQADTIERLDQGRRRNG